MRNDEIGLISERMDTVAETNENEYKTCSNFHIRTKSSFFKPDFQFYSKFKGSMVENKPSFIVIEEENLEIKGQRSEIKSKSLLKPTQTFQNN